MSFGVFIFTLFLVLTVSTGILSRWMLSGYTLVIAFGMCLILFGFMAYFLDSEISEAPVPSYLVKQSRWKDGRGNPLVLIKLRGTDIAGWITTDYAPKYFEVPSRFTYKIKTSTRIFGGHAETKEITFTCKELSDEQLIEERMKEYAAQKKLERFQKELNTIKNVKVTLLEQEPRSPKLEEKFTLM